MRHLPLSNRTFRLSCLLSFGLWVSVTTIPNLSLPRGATSFFAFTKSTLRGNTSFSRALSPLQQQQSIQQHRPSMSMAWRSSGSSNADLVSNLHNNGLIRSERVKQAMLGVDRGHYSPSTPYTDSPQSIGHSATISAPHMHASASESLLSFLHPTAHVLDVGSGSGYLSHVLANLIGDGDTQGKVVGIEHIPELVTLAEGNMAKSPEGKKLLETGKVRFVAADGRKGWPEDGPYDAIHVGAAASELHQELVDQLKSPGRLFIPVEESSRYGDQWIWVIDKDENGKVTKKRKEGVRYVPLTDRPQGTAP